MTNARRLISDLLPARGEKKPGAAPGTMVHVGKRKVEEVKINFFDYNPERLEEGSIELIEECFPLFETDSVTWVNVLGLHNIEVIRRVADHIKLHPLVVEDILDTNQRAKVEEYEGVVYIVLRMLSTDPDTDLVVDEQVSLVLGENFVFSFQERPGDVFEPVRERLRHGRGLIRTRGADYLAYALIDAVVDRYFGVLETVGDRLEDLEDSVLADGRGGPGLEEIQSLRRESILVRRAVWPLRDVISTLYRGDSELVRPETVVFLRDVHDHAVQVIDTAETLRELASGVMDLHMSALSNRMNEVMKVLTIIATIFIPLSFLAGVYGMNFDVMPELHQPWGYPALLSVMFAVGVGMLGYFRRKGWF